MKFKFATAAAAILAVSLFATYANAGQEAAPVKKHTATAKEKKPKPPTVEEQIQDLRQDFQNQINRPGECRRFIFQPGRQRQRCRRHHAPDHRH